MSTHYDIEIWPNTAKVKKILIYMAGITILAWIAHFAGNFFWDDYSYEVTKASTGVTGRAGWPVTLYWWGIYIGVLGPVALIMLYLMQERKNPVLALKNDGLFINKQMIKQTLVEW